MMAGRKVSGERERAAARSAREGSGGEWARRSEKVAEEGGVEA